MIRSNNDDHRRPRRKASTMTLLCLLSAMTTSAAAATAAEARPLLADVGSRYDRIDAAPDRSVSGGARLGRSMRELTEALSDTRRILDGEGEGASENGEDEDEDEGEDGQVEVEAEDGVENENEDDGSSSGDASRAPTTTTASSKPVRPSSDWWERLYQGGPLYDEKTGKLIEETVENGGSTLGTGSKDEDPLVPTRPANRRSHSATVYTAKNSDGSEKEWMIVSGGFTDEDWNSFPVWAYDLSESKSIAEIEDEIALGVDLGGVGDPLKRRPWVDLTKLSSGGDGPEMMGMMESGNTAGSSDAKVVPQGRVGHLSSVYKDCLYIFGGLTYQLGAFHVDYNGSEEGDGNSMAIWKACGLDGLLSGDANAAENAGGLSWEKIVPTVSDRPPMHPVSEESAEGADRSSSNDEDAAERSKDEDDPDRRRGTFRKRARRTYLLASKSQHNVNTTIIDDEKALHHATRSEGVVPKPSFTLPRGEAQGGHYKSNTGETGTGDCFVFYGGMHHHHSLTEGSLQATTILGDIWRFDYETETLSMLSPYPPLPWQRDERNGSYPKARTAHAGTIVGSELIIHGGMRFSDDDPNRQSSFSSPSNSYATYKTSSRWQPLSDVWVFDLETLTWRERIQYPQLARSYHSLVGWGNGTVAAFGGFQQDNNIPGETVAFVFKDLILSKPNETYWKKLIPPSSGYNSRPGITNRLEHTAVVDKYGSMYIWGGRFQTVSQIVGLWRLDVFTEDSHLKYENAPPDGIEQYEAELQALHMFIATMMFMSLTISSLFSMMRRQGAEVGNGGGGGVSSFTRRGLSRQMIDSLPLKRYEAPHTEVTEDGDVVEDVSLSRENSQDESTLHLEENADCCPICLVEYEDGVSEIRTLPCGHVFDKECIDSWLAEHTTCPSCREELENTMSSTSLGGLRHRHWDSHFDTSGVSDDPQASEDDLSNDDSHDHHVHSVRPRFLAIRQLFRFRGHIEIGVSSFDEDEADANIESIELV